MYKLRIFRHSFIFQTQLLQLITCNSKSYSHKTINFVIYINTGEVPRTLDVSRQKQGSEIVYSAVKMPLQINEFSLISITFCNPLQSILY